MAQPAAAHPVPSARRRNLILGAVASSVVVAMAIFLWGGYTQNWEWTGVTAQDTLWFWLQLLAVPIAFATLPLVLRGRDKMRTDRKVLLATVVVAFAVFVFVAYSLPLEWTGFPDQALWDWLTLLLLPTAIISVRFLVAERQISTRHYVLGVVIVVCFLILVLGGYLVPWEWTGFTGNTLLDWVQLLFLPIFFPTVVVPAIANWLTASKVAEEEWHEREPPASR
jgi:hypothetical protein